MRPQRTCSFLSAFGLVTALVLLGSPSASAGPVLVTLSDATFDDGGTLTGSFVYDPDAYSVTHFHLTASGGDTSKFAPFTFDTSNAVGSPTDAHGTTQYTFATPGYSEFLAIAFSPNVTDAGGQVSLIVDPGTYFQYVDSTGSTRSISGGTAFGVPPTSVPEPSSLLMVGIGAPIAFITAWKGLRRSAST